MKQRLIMLFWGFIGSISFAIIDSIFGREPNDSTYSIGFALGCSLYLIGRIEKLQEAKIESK